MLAVASGKLCGNTHVAAFRVAVFFQEDLSGMRSARLPKSRASALGQRDTRRILSVDLAKFG